MFGLPDSKRSTDRERFSNFRLDWPPHRLAYSFGGSATAAFPLRSPFLGFTPFLYFHGKRHHPRLAVRNPDTGKSDEEFCWFIFRCIGSLPAKTYQP